MRENRAYSEWRRRINYENHAFYGKQIENDVLAWRKGDSACIRINDPKMPNDKYADIVHLTGKDAIKIINEVIESSGEQVSLARLQTIWFDPVGKNVRITLRFKDANYAGKAFVVSKESARSAYSRILDGFSVLVK